MANSHSVTRAIVRGNTVDGETRCVHYASDLDIVAVKFACCGEYYPCHACHEECAGHAASVWPLNQRERAAVLCGVCRYELTINAYLGTLTCPACESAFNPGCRLHSALYFEVEEHALPAGSLPA